MNMMSYEYGALDQESGDAKSPCEPRNHSICMDFTYFLFKDFIWTELSNHRPLLLSHRTNP